MPRFVRPAFLRVTADGNRTTVGTGPRRADGWLDARLTLRTPDGSVSEPVTIEAGGPQRVAIISIPPTLAMSEYGPGMWLISTPTEDSKNA